MSRFAIVVVFVSGWMMTALGQTTGQPQVADRVLVFTKDMDARPDSIPAGIKALKRIGDEQGFAVDATDDAGTFTPEFLAQYAAVVFLNTTGDVLNDQQQAAFESYIRGGHGFVGIDAATDTERDWVWYGKLVGARSAGERWVQKATIEVRDVSHPSTRFVSAQWQQSDEWCQFEVPPAEDDDAAALTVLTVFRAPKPDGSVGADRPFSWCRKFDGGRSWCTVGGHTVESFGQRPFLQHLLGGIQWAAGMQPIHRARVQTQPAKARSLGTVTYSGSSRWQGMIHVVGDHATYENGTFSARAPGIPQGITFSGNRRGVQFRNLTFTGVGDGLSLENDQSAEEIMLDSCQFIDCRSPDTTSNDPLMGHRGYGMFVSKGKNWTIRNCTFKTKVKDPANVGQRDWSTQYAMRLGALHGLKVSDSRFENWAGKSSVWLMFVHDAVFERVEISGGPLRIGARPNEMPGVALGDCRNITFRDCQFTFGDFYNWPASILVFPGTENLRFENCRFTTVEGCGWWIDIDPRRTRNIRWTNCTWNGKPIEGFAGVRTDMTEDQMRENEIGPSIGTPTN